MARFIYGIAFAFTTGCCAFGLGVALSSTLGLLTPNTEWILLPLGLAALLACVWGWRLIGRYYADQLSPNATALLNGLKWSTLVFFGLLPLLISWADSELHSGVAGLLLTAALSFLVVFLPLALKPILLGRLRARKAKAAARHQREHMLQTLARPAPSRSGGLLERWLLIDSHRSAGSLILRKAFIQVSAAAISGVVVRVATFLLTDSPDLSGNVSLVSAPVTLGLGRVT